MLEKIFVWFLSIIFTEFIIRIVEICILHVIKIDIVVSLSGVHTQKTPRAYLSFSSWRVNQAQKKSFECNIEII